MKEEKQTTNKQANKERKKKQTNKTKQKNRQNNINKQTKNECFYNIRVNKCYHGYCGKVEAFKWIEKATCTVNEDFYTCWCKT